MKKVETICYPAIFEKCDDIYCVRFPDFEGCYTNGETLTAAIKNSREALGLHYYGLETDGDKIAAASDPKDIKLDDNEKLIYIDVNMRLFREKQSNKSVTRAVTLPSWLNAVAKDSDINISALLQEALKEKLNISEQ